MTLTNTEANSITGIPPKPPKPNEILTPIQRNALISVYFAHKAKSIADLEPTRSQLEITSVELILIAIHRGVTLPQMPSYMLIMDSLYKIYHSLSDDEAKKLDRFKQDQAFISNIKTEINNLSIDIEDLLGFIDPVTRCYRQYDNCLTMNTMAYCQMPVKGLP